MTRGFAPVITFSRFEFEHEDRKITAARVWEGEIDDIRKFWTAAEINVGDWIILHPNGNITVMSDQDFLKMLAT